MYKCSIVERCGCGKCPGKHTYACMKCDARLCARCLYTVEPLRMQLCVRCLEDVLPGSAGDRAVAPCCEEIAYCREYPDD